MGSRPEADAHLVLIFADGESKPRPLWFTNFTAESFLKKQPYEDGNRIAPFSTNQVRQYTCDHHLSFDHCEKSMHECSPTNEGVMIASRAAGVYFPTMWYGTIIVAKHNPNKEPVDVTAFSFRQVIDFLQCYGAKNEYARSNILDLQPILPTLQGVQISCDGEIGLHGTPAFVCVNIPLNHPLYWDTDEGEISPLSDKLGLPLKLWRREKHEYMVDPPKWKNKGTMACQNYAGTHMMKSLDASSTAWNWAPPKWLGQNGNVTVIRKDRKPLDVKHVEAMAQFAVEKLWPMMDETKAQSDHDADFKVLVQGMTGKSSAGGANDLVVFEGPEVWSNMISFTPGAAGSATAVKASQAKLDLLGYITWDNMMAWKREFDEGGVKDSK